MSGAARDGASPRRLFAACILFAACDRGAHGEPGASSSLRPPVLARSGAAPEPLPASTLAPAPPPVIASPALAPTSSMPTKAPSALASATAESSLLGVRAGADGVPVPSFVPLVFAERWAVASAALAELPASEQARPDVRFVRARVSLELGDARAALTQLNGLETALPVLAPEIAATRARAQSVVGPYAEAAEYFERRGDTEALIVAARAEVADGALPKARSALDRALLRLGKSNRWRDAEVRARALRASVAARLGDMRTANADNRWLCLVAPLRKESDAAAAALEKSGAPLSKSERLERARALAEAGRVVATEAELAALAKASGSAVPSGRVSYARALSLYAARSDYQEAATLFERAAREDPERAAQSLFYAARSLSRAQLDERASAGYERVRRQFPSSSWAEQAAYLSARLRFVAGEYKRARALYDGYLSRYGKGARFGNDANYERALCLLESDQPLAAAVAFEGLAARDRDRRSAARLRYLAALGRGLAQEPERAIAGFSEVAQSEPLSFFGLAARARLALAGAPLPPLLGAGPSALHAALEPDLPPAVRALSDLGLARDAERVLSEQELGVSRAHAPRGSEALCQAYGALGVAKRRYRIAQDRVRPDTLDVAPTVANGWAWHCIYPEPYSQLVRSSAEREALPAAFLWAVMRQESAFDPSASSPANAFGLLQLIPPTARRIAEQLHEPFVEGALLNPDLNVRYGAHYLAQLNGYFKGQYALVAAAYNAGPEAVFRWLNAPEKIGMDAFVARIPFDQTRSYVERVLGNFARYQYLSGGEAAVAALNLDLPHSGARPDDVF